MLQNKDIAKIQEIKQDFIEHKLDDRVMLAIVELIAVLEFLIDDFDIEVMY